MSKAGKFRANSQAQCPERNCKSTVKSRLQRKSRRAYAVQTAPVGLLLTLPVGHRTHWPLLRAKPVLQALQAVAEQAEHP